MKFNIFNIFSGRVYGFVMKQMLLAVSLACSLFAVMNVNATIVQPTLSQQSYGDYVPGGLVHVTAEINGISSHVKALGIRIILPEGLTYEMQSISDLWMNEKTTENGVELILSKESMDNQIQFHYLLHASPQLNGEQTIDATMFYRIDDGPEASYVASSILINEVAVNGFHRVSECMDDHTSVIQNTLFYQGDLTALGVKLSIAENTEFEPSNGSSYEVKQIDSNVIELFWKVPPDSPVEFDYVLNRTGEISGNSSIETQLFYRIDDGPQAFKFLYPNPVIFPQCDQFTISATSTEGGTIKPEGLITVDLGESQSFEMETEEGYKFYGWMVDGEIQFSSPLKEYMFNDIRSNHRITAMFKRIRYQISIVEGEHGSIQSSTGSDTVLHGNDIIFTIIPDSGYEIERILKNEKPIEDIPPDGIVIFKEVIDNQQELSVSFKPKQYEISVEINNNNYGQVITSDGRFSVFYGDSKTVSFLPEDGYVIGDVLIDGDPMTINKNYYIFRNVTQNHTLSINFAERQTHTITTQVEGNGSISPSGDVVIEHGQSKRFVFLSYPDSFLKDIIIDGIPKGPLQSYSFSFVSQDHSIKAIFEKKPTITISATVNDVPNPCGSIDPSGEITLSEGDTQTFLMIPSDECVIKDVVIDGESKGKLLSYTFWNVQKDSTIVAFFESAYTTYPVDIIHSRGGTVIPSGTITVREGDTIKIAPKPDNGYRIDNIFANSEPLNAPYELQIKKATSIIVNFTPDVAAPDADFSFNQISQVDPLSVSFKDQSTGEINKWEWDFGDGSKNNSQQISHDYSYPGKYNVSLTVTGPGGSNTKQSEVVVTKETSPVIQVKFLSTNTKGPVPFVVPFLNLTRDEEHSIQSWLWDFGDNTTSNSGADTISHVYTKAGVYTVTLTAYTADASYSDQKQSYIKIDGRRIQGRVTTADINGVDTGTAFKGCTVEVHIKSNASQYPLFIDSALTDQYGNYTITGLPAANNLIVSAWPPPDNNQYLGEYFRNKSNPINAIPQSTKTDNLEINFALTKVPQIGIKGQITKNGNALQGIEVSVFSMLTFNSQTTVSDENGYYTFTHLLDAKDYRVYAWSAEDHSEIYYYLPKDQTVGEDMPTSSVLSWDLATTVRPKDGYLENINILIDTTKIGNIRGLVRLQKNGLPISNIWVNAWSDTLKSGNGAMTDQNGAYTIVGLSIPDSLTNGYIVEIDSSDDIYPYQAYHLADNRDEAKKVKPEADQINFFLKTGNTLFGHVYNKDDEPIKGADISTWSLSKGTNNSTTTDESGLYSIPNLPPADDYVVSAFSPEYPIQYFFHKNKQKNADHVDLTNGNIYNIDFHLDEGAVIDGQIMVINDQNEQVAAGEGIFVNAWSAIDERLYTEKTDSNGYFRFTGLNENVTDYIIYVWEENYLNAFYNSSKTVHKWDEATWITPGTYVTPKTCDLLLSKGFSIQGLVTNNGQPLAGVSVEAWNSSNEFFADDVSTDDISQAYNFKLTGLPGDESYEIRFQHEKYVNSSINITIENSDVINANCTLELHARKISGSIHNLEYQRKILVKVYREGSTDVRMKMIVGTDPDSPYEVAYEFTSLKPANSYIVDIIPSTKYPYVAHKNIDLSKNDQDNIDLTLSTDTRFLKGKLVFPANAIIGETVWIYAWSVKLKSENQTMVTYDGTDKIDYEITGLKPSNDYIVSLESNVYKQQFYNNATSYSQALKIDLSEDQSNIDFVLQKGATISGNVYNSDSEPLPNIRVEAWSDSTSHLGFINTDSNGHYEIGGLKLVDDYVVYILYEQSLFYYATDKIVSKKSKATPVSTHQLANDIDFRLIQTGSISGVVRDSNNKRLENIMVTARSVSTDANNGCLTDRMGRYVINGLPVNDDYRVTASPDSDTNYMTQIKYDISTGSARINFSLITGFAVGGMVNSWDGNPVPDARVEITSNDIIQPLNCYTGENGQFLIGGIPEGDYYFLVMAPDESQLIDYFEKAFLVDDNLFTKNVTLRPASKISGTVTLSGSIGNTPLSDIMITIFSESHSFWTYAITDQSGYYAFDNIPEATDYVIKNVSDNYLTQMEINRASGETVNFALKPAVVLNGMVINAQTGSGIENALIEVRYQGTVRDETRTDSKGRFTASSLEAKINGLYTEYVIVAKYSGYPEIQARWTADQTDLLVLKMSRGNQNIIHGFVTDNDDQIPTDDVDVFVQYYYEQKRRGYIGLVECGDDGSFSIKGLNPALTYHLKIVARYKASKKKYWVGSNYLPVSNRNDAIAVSPGQDAFTFKFDSAW
jgi:PKD repeat protein